MRAGNISKFGEACNFLYEVHRRGGEKFEGKVAFSQRERNQPGQFGAVRPCHPLSR